MFTVAYCYLLNNALEDHLNYLMHIFVMPLNRCSYETCLRSIFCPKSAAKNFLPEKSCKTFFARKALRYDWRQDCSKIHAGARNKSWYPDLQMTWFRACFSWIDLKIDEKSVVAFVEIASQATVGSSKNFYAKKTVLSLLAKLMSLMIYTWLNVICSFLNVTLKWRWKCYDESH